ncbi:MAG: phosphatase PAP2 family protein [bacterium]|nr:phosphatase PAP2 family protein [bacterium]
MHNNLSSRVIVFFASCFQFVVGAFLASMACIGTTDVTLQKHRLLVAGAVLTGLVSRLVIAEMLQRTIGRKRPFAAKNLIPLVWMRPSAPSFPSGHASVFFGIAWYIAFSSPLLSLPFFAAALLISGARVLAHVHYWSDVAAGIPVGLAGALIIKWIMGFF